MRKMTKKKSTIPSENIEYLGLQSNLKPSDPVRRDNQG